MYSAYKLIDALDVLTPPVFACCNGLFANGTEAQVKVVGRIAEMKMSVLCFDTFLCAYRVSNVKWLSFSRLIELMEFIEEFDGHGVLVRVSKVMIKERFGHGIFRLINHMEFYPALAFVAAERLCKVDWHALELQDWFWYEYKTGKLSRLSGSAPMIRKLADDTEEKIAGTEAVRTIYREDFATRGMSIYIAKAVCLQ